MADTAAIVMTPEEFYAWDSGDEERYELIDGIPVKMMTGASEVHDRIITNVIALLHGQLRGGPCRPTTADVALRTRFRNIRRPDVTVTCGEPLADSYEARDPRMVVEVLSPSNTGVLWQRKLEEYRQLDGLLYILLIDPKIKAATLLTREDQVWTSSDYDTLDKVIDLPGISCQLSMSDVFEGLDVDQG